MDATLILGEALKWAGIIVIAVFVLFFGSAIIAGIWGGIQRQREIRRMNRAYLTQTVFKKRGKK